MINQYLKTLNQSNLHVETTPIGQLDQHVNFNYIHTQGYHAIEDVGIIMDNDPSFQILNQRDSRPLPLNSALEDAFRLPLNKYCLSCLKTL